MSKLSKYLIAIGATLLIGFLLWYFSNIVAYILISAVLAIIGKPIVDSLIKIKIKGRHFPRWAASLVAVVTIWSVTALFFYFFIPLIINKVAEISQIDARSIVESFSAPLSAVEGFIVRFMGVDEETFSLGEELRKQITPYFDVNFVQNTITSIVSIIGNLAVALFSITFITFFFLKEENLFRNILVTVFPTKYEQNVNHALDSVTNLLIRYFTGILAESTIIAVLLTTIFALWGFSFETALFMGFIMGLMNVIPYIGPLIGSVICLIVGVISPIEAYTITKMAVIIIGSIVVVKLLDDFLIQPSLYSNRVKAHPLEIFIVILVAGSVAGIVGMLLAIPSYTVLRVFAKEFFQNYKVIQKLTENI